MDPIIVPPDLDTPLYAKLLARAPIYDLIFSCLSPRSLVWFSWSCRTAHAAVAEFSARAFNINRHFSRYFANPIAFRNLQARTNSVVSGSSALQFFDRTFYPTADLDIYTHPGHSFEVARFLVQVEGYQFLPHEDQDPEWSEAVPDNWDGTEPRVLKGPDWGPYPSEGINDIWNFQKSGGDLKVQIIEQASSPVDAILGFHSTCVMNLITADAAYALYPIPTFDARRALAMRAARLSPAAIEKYVQRGWRVYFAPTPDDLRPRPPAHAGPGPYAFDRVRWVGDRFTWVVPLDQTGIRPRPPLSPTSAPLPWDPVRLNGWRLRSYRGARGGGGGDVVPDCYECHRHRLQTTVFRYNYAVPEKGVWEAVRRWANEQGRFSHRALSKADWVWYDADLPSFLGVALGW